MRSYCDERDDNGVSIAGSLRVASWDVVPGAVRELSSAAGAGHWFRPPGGPWRTWLITDWLTGLPPLVYHWLVIRAEPGRSGLLAACGVG
jgi:hypothetical protein